MASFDTLPQARVVRKAGMLMTPPPTPPNEEPTTLRLALAYACGLWPLTGVVLLMLGLLWMAGMNGSP
jgi:hypothetical protein